MCKYCDFKGEIINPSIAKSSESLSQGTTVVKVVNDYFYESEYLKTGHTYIEITKYDDIDGEYEEYIEINYCPMCGRGLGD